LALPPQPVAPHAAMAAHTRKKGRPASRPSLL